MSNFDDTKWNKPAIQGDVAGVVMYGSVLVDTVRMLIQNLEKNVGGDYTNEKENLDLVSEEFSQMFNRFTGYEATDAGR